MAIQLFISGLILGSLLGAFACYVFIHWMSRQRVWGKRREIDRLTEQFQELFRQIDQDKNQSS